MMLDLWQVVGDLPSDEYVCAPSAEQRRATVVDSFAEADQPHIFGARDAFKYPWGVENLDRDSRC